MGQLLTRYYGDGNGFDVPSCVHVSCDELAKLEGEVARLRAENADLLIALQVHSGKLTGTSKAQREAVVRGLTLCVAALAIAPKPTEET